MSSLAIIVIIIIIIGLYLIIQEIIKISNNINKNSLLIKKLNSQLKDSPKVEQISVYNECSDPNLGPSPSGPRPIIVQQNYPATFEEEYIDPILVSDVFEDMFSEPSPWIGSIRTYDRRKQEGINRYFINQN